MRLKEAASRQPVKTRTIETPSSVAPSFAKASVFAEAPADKTEGRAAQIVAAARINSGRKVTGVKVRSRALQVNLFVLVDADGRRLPALDRGLDEEVPRAEDEGSDGRLLKQEGLGLLEELVALLWVDGAGCGRDEPVVDRIAPAGPVVAAAGDKEVEERHRVPEVGHPA